MIASDFFETTAWQALEIVAGCDHLSEPDGEGFAVALKSLKQLKLVTYERMTACGVTAKGYRVTDAGRQLVNVMLYVRACDAQQEASA